jgi:hypothetical protein
LPDEKVAVFHLTAIGADSEETFPHQLKKFLEHKKIVACGIQIGGDLARLRRLGVNIKRRLELRQIAIRHDPNQTEGTGMPALSHRYLRRNVDKSGQGVSNDYSEIPLPTHLSDYAALDALISLKLAKTILKMVESQRRNCDILEAPTNLRDGTNGSISWWPQGGRS